MLRGYDPIERARRVEELVTRGAERKYYRFRPARFYGGIATGDVVGCNLSCIFCWSRSRDPNAPGTFYSPEAAARRLIEIAEGRGYSKLRLSGAEPTIGLHHLEALLSKVREIGGDGYLFILETNGILLGYDAEAVQRLARFREFLHVRVSVKACSEEWFTRLTGADPRGFELQLKALANLRRAGISHHPAVVLGFGEPECYSRLLERISEVDPGAEEHVEWEVVVLYPHVKRRLERAGLKPGVVVEGGRLVVLDPRWRGGDWLVE